VGGVPSGCASSRPDVHEPVTRCLLTLQMALRVCATCRVSSGNVPNSVWPYNRQNISTPAPYRNDAAISQSFARYRERLLMWVTTRVVSDDITASGHASANNWLRCD
jgi:hypothetical protein